MQNSKENGGRDPPRVTTPKSAHEMGKLGFLLCQNTLGTAVTSPRRSPEEFNS